jgi:hypothetical protein
MVCLIVEYPSPGRELEKEFEKFTFEIPLLTRCSVAPLFMNLRCRHPDISGIHSVLSLINRISSWIFCFGTLPIAAIIQK